MTTTTELMPSTETTESDVDTEEVAASIVPLRPAGDAPPTTVGEPVPSAWISRVSMSSASIEVTWSADDAAAEYHLHRVPRTSEQEPGLEAMTSDTRIHTAHDTGRFVDEGVAADTRYWHGVESIAPDGEVVAYAWHRTASVDDEEPPAMVGGITAVPENGDVLVTWVRPSENYQLHGYRVFRVLDGAEPVQVGITWQVDQTSFVDDEAPASGQVEYQIVAFDFHWNDSPPGSVRVELP